MDCSRSCRPCPANPPARCAALWPANRWPRTGPSPALTWSLWRSTHHGRVVPAVPHTAHPGLPTRTPRQPAQPADRLPAAVDRLPAGRDARHGRVPGPRDRPAHHGPPAGAAGRSPAPHHPDRARGRTPPMTTQPTNPTRGDDDEVPRLHLVPPPDIDDVDQADSVGGD